MKTQIPVPVWTLLFSAGLHLVTVVGLVAMLFLPGLAPKILTVIEIRVTATPEPVSATATPLPPTATVVRPTVTPLPPTATRLPVATAVPCQQGEVAGVDCPIDVDGLSVTVVSLERTSVFTVTIETGEEIPYVPVDEKRDEFLIVHLALPDGTLKADLNSWFENGGKHAPTVVDEKGEVYDYAAAFVEEREGGFGVAIIFVVPKDAKNLTLRIQGGATVDLSLVPDLTVEAEATPPVGPSPTPAPTATSIFNP